MKPINCPLEERNKKFKSYLRFVNKDTLEYLDMPAIRGKNVEIYFDLLENADVIVGNVGSVVGGGNIKRDFHYMMLFTLSEQGGFLNKEMPVGFFMRRGKLFRADINPETNEITYANEIPGYKEGVEFTSIGFKKENDKWYRIKVLHTPGKEDTYSFHKQKIIGKRKTTYDKIFI